MTRLKSPCEMLPPLYRAPRSAGLELLQPLDALAWRSGRLAGRQGRGRRRRRRRRSAAGRRPGTGPRGPLGAGRRPASGPAACARRRADRRCSRRTGSGRPGRPVELAVGHELAVGVEDRVGPEARLEDVGLRLGDLEELRAEVEAALERRCRSPVEGQAVGGPSSSASRGSRASRRAGRGRGRDRLRLGRGDRLLKDRSAPRRSRDVVTEVGIPLGVEAPGRPPRICPVPGRLLPRAPPPAPGAVPSERGRATRAARGSVASAAWARCRERLAAARPQRQNRQRRQPG